METLQLLVLVQAMSAWFLTGLIWVIQIVHYPLMAGVGTSQWVAYQRSHMSRITWIVAPAMLIEATSCFLCLLLASADSSAATMLWNTPWAHAALAALLGLVWVSTWLLQVPAHRTLSTGLDPASIRRLVVSNWIRTTAWSVRAALLAFMIGSMITPQ